jgi:hypothetical protein
VKISVTVHELPGATEAPMQFVEGALKSPGLFPPSNTEEMVNGALPELVTVTLEGALEPALLVAGKFMVPGTKVMAGAGGGAPFPVPVRLTDCGLPGALSVIVSCA